MFEGFPHAEFPSPEAISHDPNFAAFIETGLACSTEEVFAPLIGPDDSLDRIDGYPSNRSAGFVGALQVHRHYQRIREAAMRCREAGSTDLFLYVRR